MAMPSPSSARPIVLALAFGVAVAAAGCVDDPASLSEGLSQPLAATPRAVDYGTFAAGTTATARVVLTNQSRTTVDISAIQLVPPDSCFPPDPCYPPDPCRIELIQPCIRPGDSTTLTVSCTPTVAGALDFRASIDYTQPGGGAYRLSVPFHGTVR